MKERGIIWGVISMILILLCQQNARLAFVDNSRNDSLVNKCEKIRREYRNKAAHIDIVTKRQAENCYRAVIGKIDAYDYNTNVTSALLELFSILK